MFLGREAELKFLNERYLNKRGEFIILYGRRRIGKTELLSEFCKGKKSILYTCNEYTSVKQLAEFSAALLPTQNSFLRYVDKFSDWKAAFASLGEYDQSEKIVIVIDEFPYMAKADPSIPSIIQNLWDHTLRHKNIMLILSGSSMSFIENELLAYKKPMYGRTTGICKLEPMPYCDAIKFFPSFSADDRLIAYSILGGIPHYLSQFDDRMSLAENIKRTILSKTGALHDEVDFLLHQELREPAVYITIIETIAHGYNKFSAISEQSTVPGEKLTTYLKNLIELGIVIKEMPALSTTKDALKKSNGEYILADNFFRFYYRFVHPNKSLISVNNLDAVWKNLIEGNLHSFASKGFENVCIEYVGRMNDRSDLPFFAAHAVGRWWGKVTKTGDNNKPATVSEEIDLVTCDAAEENYIVGECKFRNEPFDMNELNKLIKKVPFRGNIYYYLFSLSGFTDAVKEAAKENPNIRCFSIEDVEK